MKRHRLCGIGLIFLASLLSTSVWALSSSPASLTFTGVRGVLGQTDLLCATNLQLGHTYYFAVSAYDTSGNESTLSAIVSKSHLDRPTDAA